MSISDHNLDALVMPAPMDEARLFLAGAVAHDCVDAASAFWDRLSPLLGPRADRQGYAIHAPTGDWADASAERAVDRGRVKIGYVARTGQWRLKGSLAGARLFFVGDIPAGELRGRLRDAVGLLMHHQHPEGY